MIGFVFGILDFILIKSWIWLIKMFFNTLKYMAMAVVSIFVGPGKTIHRLAVSNTERKTGLPYDQTPDLFKINKTKVTAWMIWAYLYWAFVIVGVAISMTGGVS